MKNNTTDLIPANLGLEDVSVFENKGGIDYFVPFKK